MNLIKQIQQDICNLYEKDYTFTKSDINENFIDYKVKTCKIYVIYNDNHIIYDIIYVKNDLFINLYNVNQWLSLVKSSLRSFLLNSASQVRIKLVYDEIPSEMEAQDRVSLLKTIYQERYIANNKNLDSIDQLVTEVNIILVEKNKKSTVKAQKPKKEKNINYVNGALQAWQNPEFRAARLAKIELKKVPVQCITTGEIFASVGEAAEKYNVHRITVIRSAKGEQKGFKDKNGKLLQWQYLDLKKQEKREQTLNKEKTYSLYYLLYNGIPKMVIISSLSMNQILPYQKCNKTAPAYTYIQQYGYENFTLKCVTTNIKTRKEAKQLKKEHIQQLSINYTLYNVNL